MVRRVVGDGEDLGDRDRVGGAQPRQPGGLGREEVRRARRDASWRTPAGRRRDRPRTHTATSPPRTRVAATMPAPRLRSITLRSVVIQAPRRYRRRIRDDVRLVQDRRGAVPYALVMAPRFDVIGVVVADMATSLAFYRRLGLDVPPDADASPHVEVALPGRPAAGVRHRGDRSRSFDELVGRGRAVAIASPWRSRATRRPTSTPPTRRSSTRGARGTSTPWDAFWGQRYAVVLDPDGGHVELFAPLGRQRVS